MQIVLHEAVSGLGVRGDIVEVSDGYARNYLIPSGKAQRASAGVVAQADAMKRSWQVRNAKEREAAEEVAKILVARTIEIKARAGGEGKLFGSIGTSDIAEATSKAGFEIERSEVRLPHGPIRQAGEHIVQLHLHTDVTVELPVTIVAEE